MKQKKIIPYEGKGKLAEIAQSMQLKMALTKKVGDDTLQIVTPGVRCRDFLTDVFTFSKAKRDFEIYGMKWDGSKQQPDYDEINLFLTIPNKALIPFGDNLSLLNKIELANGYEPSQYIGETGTTGILRSSSNWLQNCLTFSLFTLLVRGMCYPAKSKDWIESLSNNGSSDASYFSSVHRSVWDRILPDLSQIYAKEFCGFDASNGYIGEIHHNSGIISVFGRHSEMSPSLVRKNTHWKEMKTRGFKLYTA